MYSHFSTQQSGQARDNNGTASPAVNLAVTSTPGWTWNGSSWSKESTPASNSGISVTDWGCNRNQTIPVNPVATYTDYYHKWMAKHLEQDNLIKSSSLSPHDHAVAQRQLEWYKYYADQSSRAAHYFNNCEKQKIVVTTAPFDLPPEPPQLKHPQHPQQQVSTASVDFNQAKSQEVSANDNTDGKEANNLTPLTALPDSLKRFVDRCLSQYDNLDEKAEMMKCVQDTIQTSVKSCSVHSTLWDTLPAIKLAGKATAVPSQPMVKASHAEENHQMKVAVVEADDDKDSMYGPSSSRSSDQCHASKGGRDRPTSPTSRCSSTSTSSGGHRKYSSYQYRRRRGGRHYTDSNNHSFFTNQSDNKGNNCITVSGSSTSSYNQSNQNEFVNSKVNNKKRLHKSTRTKNDKVDNSYYGPSHCHHSSNIFSYTSKQSNAGNDSPTEDFISLSHKKQRQMGSNNNNTSDDGFNNSNKAMIDRSKRFAGPGGSQDSSASGCLEPDDNTKWDRYMGKATIGGNIDGSLTLDETDFEVMKVKGTCTIFEKNYLRLTAPPKPELVRPQYILEQHLANLKRLRKTGSNRDYSWFCSQLKAVRQDMTVQHLTLNNPFAVDVYETHARIALEEGDLNEFNQCQTQLKDLYSSLADAENMDSHLLLSTLSNQSEFIAYRLLYYVLMTGNQKYDGGSSEMFRIMLSLSHKERTENTAIKHALQVREAIADSDYHLFFTLKQCAPNLGSLLMDRMVPALRYNALHIICKAYRPDVEVCFVLKELGFLDMHVTDGAVSKYGRDWLISCGCVLSEDQLLVITKDSVLHESTLEEKESLI